MKKVYIFFIATSFKTGKTIRFLTGNKYNHVAFSFDKEGSVLYSYSRYRYNEPLLSGFGIEYTDRYADNITRIKVCEYKVTNAHYKRIKQRINKYSALQEKAQYNFFDVIGYPFHIHVNLKYSHTCISFLLMLLERKDIHTIGQLEQKLASTVIYEGSLNRYIPEATSGEIDFYEKRSNKQVCADTLKSLGWLTLRFICGIIAGTSM